MTFISSAGNNVGTKLSNSQNSDQSTILAAAVALLEFSTPATPTTCQVTSDTCEPPPPSPLVLPPPMMEQAPLLILPPPGGNILYTSSTPVDQLKAYIFCQQQTLYRFQGSSLGEIMVDMIQNGQISPESPAIPFLFNHR